LGSLSVVYDQAGKARIVGVTNWWIQVALKPLHSDLFNFLSSLPEDGTFDQSAPLDRLLQEISPDQKLWSFDLSSATDRLPVALQEEILNELGFNGCA
jgi:hypothetical protein